MRFVWLLFVILPISSCVPQGRDSNLARDQRTKHLFYPQFDKGPSPAILVIPQNDLIARKLAMAGYVTLAMKYGEKDLNNKDAEKLERIKRRVSDNLEFLKRQSTVDPKKMGVLGVSFGGFFATYLASRPGETGLRGAVIYYGVHDVPEDIKNLRVPVLAFQGDADSFGYMPRALAMQKLAQTYRKPFELVIYRNAEHSFGLGGRNNAPGDQTASEDSWNRMIAFLDEHVKNGL